MFCCIYFPYMCTFKQILEKVFHFVVPILKNNIGSIYVPKQSIKNFICLKDVSLKVSETLRTKKIEVMCQMHTSASVQTQSPVPKAVKHKLQEEKGIIYFLIICLSTESLERALRKASCGWSMFYSSLPYSKLIISFLFPVSLFLRGCSSQVLVVSAVSQTQGFQRGTTLCMRV